MNAVKGKTVDPWPFAYGLRGSPEKKLRIKTSPTTNFFSSSSTFAEQSCLPFKASDVISLLFIYLLPFLFFFFFFLFQTISIMLS